MERIIAPELYSHFTATILSTPMHYFMGLVDLSSQVTMSEKLALQILYQNESFTKTWEYFLLTHEVKHGTMFRKPCLFNLMVKMQVEPLLNVILVPFENYFKSLKQSSYTSQQVAVQYLKLIAKSLDQWKSR